MATLPEMIPTIFAKTEQGKLNWEELANNSYVAKLGSATLELVRRPDDTYLHLRREDGVVVESTSFGSLPSSSGLDNVLLRLYDAARRKSLGVDILLNDLKAQLDKL